MSTTADTVTPRDSASPTFWASIRESLAGAHGRDFTVGPVRQAILILAIPMVLEMLMESIFAVVDVFVVAHLGAEAVATVGLTESFMTILYALSMGVSIGAGAMVARRIGEKDAQGAAHTAAQVIILGLIVSCILSVTGAHFAPELLGLMGGTPGIIHNATYTRIMFVGDASVVMLYLINSILRSSGDAAVAMRVLWLANGINIILSPCLVFGFGPFPKLGIAGAAVGTVCGRGIGVLFAFSRLLRPDSRVRVQRKHFAFDPELIVRVVKLSAAATMQMFIGMASWIGLVRIVATFGSSAIAGWTIGLRVIIFALLPSFGLSNAAATMVGQALGAGKPDRAETAVWKAGLYNAVFLGIVGLLFVVFATSIVGGFTTDSAVAHYAVAALRTVAYGFVFYAYGMVITQAFNGAGDTATPTWINFGIFWALEIPLAYVLARPLGMGPQGVFWAVTVAFSLLTVVSAILFKRGTWKTRQV